MKREQEIVSYTLLVMSINTQILVETNLSTIIPDFKPKTTEDNSWISFNALTGRWFDNVTI